MSPPDRCANPRCDRPHVHTVFRMAAGVPTWFCSYRCCQEVTGEPDRVALADSRPSETTSRLGG